MKNYHLSLMPFLLLCIAFLYVSCSKTSRNPAVRLYHNTTSYFNGYYNANKLFFTKLDDIDKAYVFPDAGFIDITHYLEENETKTYSADFEKVVKKNDVVIFKHPKSKMVDDCRFLNGKAFFYRGNYDKAMQNFEEVLIKFAHSKITPEVHFWIAQTYFMMDNMEMAKSTLEEYLAAEIDVKKRKMKGDLAIFRALIYIKEKQPELAADMLEKNLRYIKGKRKKAKTHYLLGQLYADFGNYPEALKHFSKVEKMTNDYNVAFKGKMKRMEMYVDFPGDKYKDSDIYKELKKMLKEDKNLDFRDQIYYQYALMEIKNLRKGEAIDLLKKSVRTSTTNTRQKALSYYKIGQIYFEKKKYPLAGAYYDSAMTTMPATAPEYKEIKIIGSTMKDYVTYRNTIQYQDSMLTLADMPRKELDSLVAKVAAEDKKKKEEARLKAEKEADAGNTTASVDPNAPLGTQKGANGVWYYDDNAAVSEGRLQFRQNWGIRKNEDDWRRSKKAASFSNPDGEGGDLKDPLAGAVLSKEDSVKMKEYGENFAFYENIPFKEEDKKIGNEKLEEAYYKLAQLYDQKLNQQDSAVKTYAKLLKRYPESKYLLPTHYAMYRACKNMGKTEEANVHKKFIIDNYPKSIYAMLLQGIDPKDIASEGQDFQYAYTGLFKAFRFRQYETAIGFSSFLIGEYDGHNDLAMEKVYYIRALSYGYLGELDSTVALLNKVIKNYPTAPTKEPAQRILDAIAKLPKGTTTLPDPNAETAKENPDGEETAGKEEAEKVMNEPCPKINESDAKYDKFRVKPRPTEKYFVLILINKDNMPQEDIKNKIADFNTQNFRDNRLKVAVFSYKEDYLLPYINSFSNEEEAKKYIKQFYGDKLTDGIMKAPTDRIFYIAQSYFAAAYGERKMEDYLDFYDVTMRKCGK